MKRFLKIITVIVAVAICAVTLGACNTTTEGGSKNRGTDLEIGDPRFDFVNTENYDEETYVFNPDKKTTSLSVDTEYYLFLDFEVTARQDNDGQSVLDVNITFTDLGVFDAKVQEANTGEMVEHRFLDATTGSTGKILSLSFKVPPQSAKPKRIEMSIKLRPVKKGESHIKFGFKYNAPEQYLLQGSDGKTKNIEIKEVTIETPVLSLTQFGALKWNHVKNADYYYIYEQSNPNNPLVDDENNPIVLVVDDQAVGSELIFPIAQYLVGYHILVIRAHSNNPSIMPSSVSNYIEREW